MRLAILIGVGLLGTLPCHRAEAAIVYPWCAHYMAPNTAHNCGFVTLGAVSHHRERYRRNLRGKSILFAADAAAEPTTADTPGLIHGRVR